MGLQNSEKFNTYLGATVIKKILCKLVCKVSEIYCNHLQIEFTYCIFAGQLLLIVDFMENYSKAKKKKKIHKTTTKTNKKNLVCNFYKV